MIVEYVEQIAVTVEFHVPGLAQKFPDRLLCDFRPEVFALYLCTSVPS